MKSKLNSVLIKGGGKLFVKKLICLLFITTISLGCLKAQFNSYCGAGYLAADNFSPIALKGKKASKFNISNAEKCCPIFVVMILDMM